MQDLHLYMLLLGCKPKNRFTEQHDMFFGISDSLKGLVPAIKASWPEAKRNLHIDAWRKVTSVGNYSISVKEKDENCGASLQKLYFINLGGYKAGEFDEFHYKMLIVTKSIAAAIKQAKSSLFFKHTGFKGAPAHIDEKYLLDVDDVFEVAEILPALKDKYRLCITETNSPETDHIHLGYFSLWKIKD